MSDASSLWRVRGLEDDSVTCMYLSLWFFWQRFDLAVWR